MADQFDTYARKGALFRRSVHLSIIFFRPLCKTNLNNACLRSLCLAF